MCSGGSGQPGSYAEALVALAGSLDHLNRAVAAGEIPEFALGEVLLELEASGAKHAALRSAVLSAFDAADAHDPDGYQNSSSWLRDKAGMTHRAAKGQMKQMRALRVRPLLAGAMTEGRLHDSYAADIVRWTKPLPVAEKTAADEILLGALDAGASPDDLYLLCNAIVEKYKSTRPDPGDPDDGFDDRRLVLDTTMDGAGRLTGDLTPRAAAALIAVLESLGKKRGPEDTRSEAQRFHDALEEACDLLIASVLLTGLLPSPFSTKSVVLDVGYSDRIPEPIRRAVITRAGGHCEWPGGCDRPAAASDVHHVVHKKDGGPTSVTDCFLACKFHHLVVIHRWGWRVELRADGGIVARGPDGQVIEGHPRPRRRPPPSRAA
jgi:hypothetical protein